MKKLLFIIPILLLLVGCSSFGDKKGVDDFDNYIIGEKEGIIVLEGGQRVVFSHAVITSTFRTVRIFSEVARYTFLWNNVLELHIYHDKSPKENKEEDKKEDTKVKGI